MEARSQLRHRPTIGLNLFSLTPGESSNERILWLFGVRIFLGFGNLELFARICVFLEDRSYKL
jgi:hypothetical protein